MGWIIKLKSNKKLSNEFIKEIMINDFTEEQRSQFDADENEWGWQCVVDIKKPDNKKVLELYGSNDKFIIGCKFAYELINILKKKGYKVKIDKIIREIGKRQW